MSSDDVFVIGEWSKNTQKNKSSFKNLDSSKEGFIHVVSHEK